MQEAALPMDEQRKTLSLLFQQKAHTAGVINAHIRHVRRLLKWAKGKGMVAWTLGTLQLSWFLRDMSHGGHSVPGAIHHSLVWANKALQIGWDLDDELVTAVTAMSKRAQRAARQHATPSV